MTPARIPVLILAGAVGLCLLVLREARTQSAGLRRITNTTEEGININPSISGDGRIVAFESTEDIAGTGGPDHFRAIRANISVDPATFFQMGGTRAVTPAISQDGSRIAFASKDDPLGANLDGNSEIFLFDGAKLIQVTNTSPGDIANRVTNGNFQPSISDDGRFIAFSSNRNLTNQNADANLEVFLYDTVANNFTQLTNSSGIVGFSDAKISGNGNNIAYVRDPGATPSAKRDLLEQPRIGSGPTLLLAAGVQSLALTYGRAISDDGTRVVFWGETAANSSQVFLYDGREGSAIRQITALGVRVTEVPLHPTISGDGTRIAFATRRPIPGFSNSDNSIELYTYDTPTAQFARVTSAPVEADGFDGSLRVTEVVSSLNDEGSIVAFNFSRALSGPVTAGLENRSEIYVKATAVRPPFGTLTVLNGASFGTEPSQTKAIAPDSIAVARGSALANTSLQSQRLPNGTFPTNVAGTRVTVNGRAAQIFFVSRSQVNFLAPPQTELGSADVVVTNPENFSSRGTVPTLRAAPGVFTKPGDGTGPGVILNSDTLQEGPFDPTGGNLRLTIFMTGARAGVQTLVSIGGRVVNAESVIPSPDMPGLDEVHVLVPADLRAAGTVNLFVQSDGRDSNVVTVTFIGDPNRAIFINEVLADPPDGTAGDANHDGVRDGTQDEFVELVNGTSQENISLSGWTIRTQAGNNAEILRFTFPANTTIPPGEAVVVFGGGGANFNPNDPVFGCAQVVKASTTAGLSLTNAGLTILIRDGAGNLITQFSYGGATGLDGDNNQSLTRSPDVTGNFMQHAAATGASGRRFSPGLKTDGTPFGNCAGRLNSISISPASATVTVGQTTQFTAQAFDQFGRPMVGSAINFASDNTTAATVDSVSMNSSTGVATATITGRNPGMAHINASATQGPSTVNSAPATLTVNGPSLSINDVSLNEGNAGITTFTFTVSLSTPAPSGVTFNIETADNTATLANNDYVARSLTGQTIAAGQQTYTFDMSVNGDANIEPNETFFVNVTNVIGASVSDGQGAGTIVNDDSPVLSVNDVSANEGNSGTTTFTFTVRSTIPAPSGGITFDIATQDNTATSASGDYLARSLTGQTIAAGLTTYTFDVKVNGDLSVEPNETFFVNISNVSNASVNDGQGLGTIQNDDTATVVISQVYGGGGNSGATYRNDYVEIFNRGTTTVDLAGWSVQQASATGTSWSVTALCPSGSCLLNPGKYFLVQEASGGAVGANLPAPDAVGTSNLSVTSGKVALVNNSTALIGSGCPFSASVVDFVGYGTTADCFQGTERTPAHSNTSADFRKSGGCIDTNDNAADFVTSGPNPRNSSSAANDCSTGFRPDISINDVTVTEGDTGTKTVDFTISLSAANNAQSVTVNYNTADGTATAGSDYQSANGTVTFNPGQTSRPVTITIIGDTADEPNETFLVNLSNPANGAILNGQGVGTITDDDVPPTLTINDVSQNEGDSGTSTFHFTVDLSAPALTGGVTFDIATQDNTAFIANNDYVAHTLTSQMIAAGQQTFGFDVTVNSDLNIEPNESFFVNVTNVSGAVVGDGQGVGTILNDDSPVLSINDFSANETNSGTTTFTFTVTSSLPAPAGGITFDIATQDNTATTAGADYVLRSLTSQTIPATQTSYTFDITANGDTLVEPNETFFVNVTNASNATIGDGQGVATIQNDDTANLVISQVYGGGNNSGAPFRNDFVEIFNRGMTSVDFSITPYSVQYASVGSNFGTSRTNLTTGTIAPGQYFLVQEAGGTTNGVPLSAPDATGSIAMAAAAGKVALVAGTMALATSTCPGDDGSSPFNPSNSLIADFVGYGDNATTAGHCYEGVGPAPAPSNKTADSRKAGGCTDTDNNAADFLVSAPFPRNTTSPINNCVAGTPPNLSINDVTVTEGNSGTVIATLTVSLSAPAPSTDVIFDIATQNNSATTGNNDYVTRSLTNQVIPAGKQTFTFDVTINGDVTIEPDETFFVNVTNVVGATVSDGQGVGTIQNDDLPTLSINDVSLNEGNGGPTTFQFTVSLSAPAPGTITFDIATADGTAQDGNPVGEDNDYAARALTSQSISIGLQTYTFDVPVNGDLNIEPNETFFVNVTNAWGATVTDGQGQGTILNDDSPALSIDDVTATEGNRGTRTFSFQVSLSLPAGAGGVTFDITTADGTAQDHNPLTEDNDYVARSLTAQTIPAGQQTYTFDVTVNGDTLVEPDQTFFVNVSNVSGATVLDSHGLGTIQNDDTPLLVISQIYGGGGNTSATHTNDFIEIFNRGTTTVDFSVTPYSVQYAAATSNFSTNKTDIISGTLLPGHYFLIQEASGGAVGAPLPTPDASGTINLAAAAGKVALVAGTIALTGSGCPLGATIADFLGYGTTANCSETAPIAVSGTNSNARSVIRTASCTDTNNNSADFSNPTTAPTARNTSSSATICP